VLCVCVPVAIAISFSVNSCALVTIHLTVAATIVLTVAITTAVTIHFPLSSPPPSPSPSLLQSLSLNHRHCHIHSLQTPPLSSQGERICLIGIDINAFDSFFFEDTVRSAFGFFLHLLAPSWG
jgi:hypothetical protein